MPKILEATHAFYLGLVLNDLVWFDYCSQVWRLRLWPQMLGSWGRIWVEGREPVSSLALGVAAAVSAASSATARAQASRVAAIVAHGVRSFEFGWLLKARP